MILLTSTSDILTLTTGSAGSIAVHASWVDNVSGSITPGRTNTPLISTATTTTVVGSPASVTQRNVKGLLVRNVSGSVANLITLNHSDGTNVIAIYSVTLAIGESIELGEDGKVTYYDNTGAPKMAVGNAATVATSATVANAAFYPALVAASGAPGSETVQYSVAMSYNPSTGLFGVTGFTTATQDSIVRTGALNSGSITSGFGSIDVGTDAISGGVGSFTTLSASGVISGRSTNGQVLGATNSSDADYGLYLSAGVAQQSVTGIFRSVIGGSTRSELSSTGLAVTGALSASGDITAGSGTSNATLTAGRSLQFYNTGVAPGLIKAADDTSIFTAASFSKTASSLWASNAKVAEVTSTGLAVTGALSATGDVSTQAAAGVKLSITESSTGTNKRLYLSQDAAQVTYNATFSSGGNAHVWQTGNVEQMRLDNSGNLGLGVTPSAWDSISRAFEGYNGTYFASQTNATANLNIGANAYYGGAAWKYKVTGQLATQYNQLNGVHTWSTAPSGTAGNTITWTRAMTLDTSPDLCINQATAGYANSNSASIGVNQGFMNHVSGTATSTTYWGFGYNGTTIGSIAQAGTTGVLYNVTSDYRLKDITGPVTTSGSFIDALQPKQGTWKADGSAFVGFLAHEFQAVSPSSVIGTKDEVDADGNPKHQAMQASSAEVMANIIAELQSLRQRVKELEAK